MHSSSKSEPTDEDADINLLQTRSRAAKDDSQFDNPMTKEEEAIFWEEQEELPRSRLGTLTANTDEIGDRLARNPRSAIFANILGKRLQKSERPRSTCCSRNLEKRPLLPASPELRF